MQANIPTYGPGNWSYPSESYSPVYPDEQKKKPPLQAYKFLPLDKKYHPEDDCDALKRAMKGIGTDEDAIIKVVANSTYAQREYMIRYYNQAYGKDLMKELKSEISGKFWKMVEMMFKGPEVNDCENLYKAMKGAGTKNDVLIEVLCTKDNSQAECIKEAWPKVTEKEKKKEDLLEWIKGDTTGTFEKIMCSMIGGCRSENTEPDEEKCKSDAQQLYNAGEGKLGTDEAMFTKIFGARSNAELRCIFYYYQQLTGHSIVDAIKNEFSCNAKSALLTVYQVVNDPADYYASRIFDAIKGLGTKDEQLMRIICARNEIDLPLIKQVYKRKYGEELVDAVKGDTSGDYGKLLVAIINAHN